MSTLFKPTPTDYERLILSGNDFFPHPTPSPKSSWESKARTVVISLASKAPYIGGAISYVIKSFWQEAKADIWAQVSENVSKMVDLKILEFEITRDGSELMAIKSDMVSYVVAKNKSEQAMQLNTLISRCTEMYFKLIKSNNKEKLIPFTVTFSLVHLAILKERVDSGEALYGEFDEAWVIDLQRQIENYQSFFTEQIPALIEWRSSKIIYESVTTGKLIKDTDIEVNDTFAKRSFKKSYRFVDGKDYRKDELMKIKEGWMSFWIADFAQSYASFFYTNRLLPGLESAPPAIDPAFNRITIGPFSPGSENELRPLRPANESQPSGKIKEIVYNFGDSLDSFQVNFESHDGQRATKIGGDKTKTIKVDPDKELVALRFYYLQPYSSLAPLKSINFVYSDGSESETAMSKDKQLFKYQEIKIPANYEITNLRSARDGSERFSYWFWLELTFKSVDNIGS
ncbi:hypothetical protein EA772_01970 [Pedobacter sp. G11]|uniref:hypothetical protein n=1 Tax=Pedobacter sp. G11 TaxID=2482728 RepID=UPI000F5EBF4E|nr:hypothetical protein [Pedobacter sp. G11]AZI24171.1 hypothetical protein EA772_01970 [Pedobacter sp. G11]